MISPAHCSQTEYKDTQALLIEPQLVDGPPEKDVGMATIYHG